MRVKNILKWQKLVILLIVLLAIISTSKIFIVLSFLYIVPWYKKKFKLNLKLIIVLLTLGLVSFIGIHISRGLIDSEDKKDIMDIAVRQINGYCLGGFAAFQAFLDDKMIINDGWVKTGDWIGNVYSGFYSYFNEKKYIYFFGRIIVMSLIYSVIYTSKKIQFDFLKIYAVFPLLFIFFSDMLFSTMLFTFGTAGFGISFIRKLS
jgi:hypothetical protein